AKDYSAHARLVISAETLQLRTSDGEHDEGACRKPCLHAIRESRIASIPWEKMIDSFAPAHFGLSACPSISLDSHRLGRLDCILHARPSGRPSISPLPAL